MPTYLNLNGAERDMREGLNCRQIYDHVQGCPVCQQIFMGMPKKYVDGGADMIKISPTVVFLVVVFIVILLVYIMRNLKNS